jgi:hypothetical protein
MGLVGTGAGELLLGVRDGDIEPRRRLLRRQQCRPADRFARGGGLRPVVRARAGASQNLCQPLRLPRPRISWCMTSTRPRGVVTLTISERLRGALPAGIDARSIRGW